MKRILGSIIFATLLTTAARAEPVNKCMTVEDVSARLVKEESTIGSPIRIVMPSQPFNLSTYVWYGKYISVVLSFSNDTGCQLAGYVMPGNEIGKKLIAKYVLGDA